MTEALLTSTILILMFFIIRRLFRGKISMRVQYALWLVIAVKLLAFPVSGLESGLSVMNWLEPMERLAETAGETYVPTAVVGTTVSVPTAAWAAGESEPLSSHSKYNIVIRKLPLTAFLGRTAFFGSILVGFWAVIYNLLFYIKIRKKRMLFEGHKGPLRVYLVEGLPTPFLYGVCIYIAPEMTVNEKRLEHILTHEYSHYKHGDCFWSFVRCICFICYWYHPLVWLAVSASRQDCELACDESAILLLGEKDRIPYGNTLLGLLAGKASPQII